MEIDQGAPTRNASEEPEDFEKRLEAHKKRMATAPTPARGSRQKIRRNAHLPDSWMPIENDAGEIASPSPSRWDSRTSRTRR